MNQTLKVGKKEYVLNNITIDLRMEILDEAQEVSKTAKFSSFVSIIRKAVKVTDDELMELSTQQIADLGLKVVEWCNDGKKSTKSK